MLNGKTGRPYSSRSRRITSSLLLPRSQLIAPEGPRQRLFPAGSVEWLFVFACLFLVGCAEERPETNAVSGPEFEGTPQAEVVKLAGAPLFEGMSDYSYPISSQVPYVQRYFDQGMVLAFAFNHAESIRSFRAAQTLDPNCAICFWGEALATGPNINVTAKGKVIMSPEERVASYAAIQKAISLKQFASEKEEALIEALSTRYNGEAGTPREPLDQAWAAAMEEVVSAYPGDATIASIYSEALMNTMPWNYWSDDLTAKPETQKVIDTLEGALENSPDHPLALHLYIHAMEASSTPERAEVAADRLANLVPGAGHLVHMPAHIYYRIGRYNDAVLANVRAADVDEAYIEACNAQGFYPALYYPHNIHFLWSAATMQGQKALSIRSARRVADNVRVEQVQQFPTIEFFRTIPLLSLVRFGDWDAIMVEPAPHPDFKFSQAIWHYARGVAQAAQGDFIAAQESALALTELKGDVKVSFLDKMDYPGSTLLSIAEHLLAGEIAYRSGRFDDAIPEFEDAVAAQETLPYTEPPFWYYPTRQSLGAALLSAAQPEEAEAVYRRDLEDHPHNGWALFGLIQTLDAQGKTEAADEARKHFETVWQFADVTLSASII